MIAEASVRRRSVPYRHGVFGSGQTGKAQREHMFFVHPILLQKSCWGVERKFLEPLMRFTRGDVRDRIASSKIDHGPSWRL